MEQQLGHSCSPSAALEILETCKLNRYAATADHPAYLITHPDAEQTAILRKLKMLGLADDAIVAETLQPRP